ncbi:RDD family protein [Yoonia sp.]|uniref:RDD family protein n=1 Tax=Yoonia sp. TaxID=2212373 RepID=UPI0025F6A923|nr:RDD family protein [Yoonia sp.]
MIHLETALPDPQRYPQFYDGVPLKRGVAWLIDVMLIGIFCVIILPFTAFTGIFFFPAMMLVVGFLYRWFTISGHSSTWGMRLAGIELRDARGAHLESGTAFLHTLGYSVSVAITPLQLVSIVMMLFSARKQGLTDHLLGTVALNK